MPGLNAESTNQCVLAIVIGRAGSKGLPGKNALPLAGRPMVCHAIEDAQEARQVDRVIVSTDGDAIAAAAASMDIEVVRRPATLAGDHATVDSAVRHAVESTGSRESIIVVLYANVPVRPDDLIDRAIARLRETGADSVQSYVDVGKYHPYWMASLTDGDKVQPYHENPIHRRQDLPRLLIPDGGVIAVTREALFRHEEGHPCALFGQDRRGIVTTPGEVIDVDGPSDFVIAEAMLRAKEEAAAALPPAVRKVG